MTNRAKGQLRETRLAICLAAALMLLLGGVTVARADGGKDAGRGVAAAAVPIRTSPPSRARQRLAEERAMVNALAGKRDPFKVPPPPRTGGGGDVLDGPLPPGVRGLVIGRLRLKGIVRQEDSDKMIAVVTNRANLAYFLHIHEDVYDGVVSRITPDAIYFQQRRPDTTGRVETREIVLRMGPER